MNGARASLGLKYYSCAPERAENKCHYSNAFCKERWMVCEDPFENHKLWWNMAKKKDMKGISAVGTVANITHFLMHFQLFLVVMVLRI